MHSALPFARPWGVTINSAFLLFSKGPRMTSYSGRVQYREVPVASSTGGGEEAWFLDYGAESIVQVRGA